MALDATSEENFNTKIPDAAKKLIDNLASSNNTKNADLNRKKLAGNMDGCQIVEMKAKIDSVCNLFVGKKQVYFVVEVEIFEPAEEVEE